jgi:hypothetical protein
LTNSFRRGDFSNLSTKATHGGTRPASTKFGV